MKTKLVIAITLIMLFCSFNVFAMVRLRMNINS